MTIRIVCILSKILHVFVIVYDIWVGVTLQTHFPYDRLRPSGLFWLTLQANVSKSNTSPCLPDIDRQLNEDNTSFIFYSNLLVHWLLFWAWSSLNVVLWLATWRKHQNTHRLVQPYGFLLLSSKLNRTFLKVKGQCSGRTDIVQFDPKLQTSVLFFKKDLRFRSGKKANKRRAHHCSNWIV